MTNNLTLKQNICAARVFLNTFGLILEEQKNIYEDSILNIFDSNLNEVGKLCFNMNDFTINITATSVFGLIKAKYKMAHVWSLEDIEFSAVQVNWNSDIYFNINSEDFTKFDGNMQIGCVLDSQFGAICRTHTSLEIQKEETKEILKFMYDGAPFDYELSKGSDKEKITISLYNAFSNDITHYITKGVYNKDIHAFPYRQMAKIKKCRNEQNILKAIYFIEKKGVVKEHNEDFTLMKSDEENSESIILKGLMMQKIDPNYVNKINSIKQDLEIDGISLFENLIDISFSSYSDEEIKALFGIKRKKIKYQNDAASLFEAYYGIDNESKLLPDTMYNKLLKRKN